MASKDFDGIHVADAIGKLKFEGNPLDLKEDSAANDGKYLIYRLVTYILKPLMYFTLGKINLAHLNFSCVSDRDNASISRLNPCRFST